MRQMFRLVSAPLAQYFQLMPNEFKTDMHNKRASGLEMCRAGVDISTLRRSNRERKPFQYCAGVNRKPDNALCGPIAPFQGGALRPHARCGKCGVEGSTCPR